MEQFVEGERIQFMEANRIYSATVLSVTEDENGVTEVSFGEFQDEPQDQSAWDAAIRQTEMYSTHKAQDD